MKNVFILLAIIVAIVLLGLFLWPIRHGVEPLQNQKTDIPLSETASSTSVSNVDNSIQVTAPKPSALVISPLRIAGQAKNPWYFEGQFPVELVDFAGTVLAKVPAQAQGDSAASGFIPFSLTLNFGAPTTTTGLLIFKNDNPSGDPSKDVILAIPVRFR